MSDVAAVASGRDVEEGCIGRWGCDGPATGASDIATDCCLVGSTGMIGETAAGTGGSVGASATGSSGNTVDVGGGERGGNEGKSSLRILDGLLLQPYTDAIIPRSSSPSL